MLTTLCASSLPVDQFREELNAVCGAFEVVPGADRSVMRGAVAQEVRGGFQFAHVAKDAQCIRRGRNEIARDSTAHCFLIVQEEGRALMSQHDSVNMLRPGDMVLIDSAEPSDFTFFGYSRQLSVHLPRAELTNRFGEVLRGGVYMPRTDHTTLAILAVLAKALQTQHNPRQSGYLGEAMYGLLGSMLFANGASPRSIDAADVVQGGLIERAVAYIDAHHNDGELTVPRLAQVLKVSDRQLQRAFADLHTTPTEYLLQKRLASACQALMHQRRTQGKTLISTIAYNSGFNDLSYFNRIFRAMFNCTPGQYALERTDAS